MQATTIKVNLLLLQRRVISVSFTLWIVKTRMIRLLVIEGPSVCDQIAFCAFHSFLVEAQMNPVYIHVMHA